MSTAEKAPASEEIPVARVVMESLEERAANEESDLMGFFSRRKKIMELLHAEQLVLAKRLQGLAPSEVKAHFGEVIDILPEVVLPRIAHQGFHKINIYPGAAIEDGSYGFKDANEAVENMQILKRAWSGFLDIDIDIDSDDSARVTVYFRPPAQETEETDDE